LVEKTFYSFSFLRACWEEAGRIFLPISVRESESFAVITPWVDFHLSLGRPKRWFSPGGLMGLYVREFISCWLLPLGPLPELP